MTIQKYAKELNFSIANEGINIIKQRLTSSLGKNAMLDSIARRQLATQRQLQLKGEQLEIQKEVLKRAKEGTTATKRVYGKAIAKQAKDLGQRPEMPWDGTLEKETKVGNGSNTNKSQVDK